MRMRAGQVERETTRDCDRFVESTVADWLTEREQHLARVRELDADISRLIDTWAR